MRRLKFRAKRTNDQQWVYGFICPGGKIEDKWYIVTNDNTYDIDIRTVGQYTGMDDKNKKEIYEGDRIFAYDRKWRIVFSEGGFVAVSGRNIRSLRNIYCEVML